MVKKPSAQLLNAIALLKSKEERSDTELEQGALIKMIISNETTQSSTGRKSIARSKIPITAIAAGIILFNKKA